MNAFLPVGRPPARSEGRSRSLAAAAVGQKYKQAGRDEGKLQGEAFGPNAPAREGARARGAGLGSGDPRAGERN